MGQGLRISVEYLGALGGSAATAGREAPSVSTKPTAGRIVECGVDPHFCSGDFLDRDLRKECAHDPGSGIEHLTLTTDAIIKADGFWAFLRDSGVPTASPEALDADAILAGQAALAAPPGDTVTIATKNLAHLSGTPRNDAQIWNQIQ